MACLVAEYLICLRLVVTYRLISGVILPIDSRIFLVALGMLL